MKAYSPGFWWNGAFFVLVRIRSDTRFLHCPFGRRALLGGARQYDITETLLFASAVWPVCATCTLYIW